MIQVFFFKTKIEACNYVSRKQPIYTESSHKQHQDDN